MIRKILLYTNMYATYGLKIALGAYFLFLIAHNVMVISSPYPIEFREGHSMSSTTLMLNGIKPFTVETYPEYYNSYGIVYNLVMLPFVYLFGNTMPIYRYINEAFFLLVIGMILFYKRRKCFNWIDMAIVCNMYLFYHINTNISIRPDGLGTFLFISTILVAFRNDMNNGSMCIAGILSVLAFFTKPYFILGWYFISVAFLIKDWKKCLVTNLLFHIFLFGCCVIINIIFPLYFYETIFAYGNSVGDISYSLNQMILSIKRLSPIIFLALVGSLGHKNQWQYELKIVSMIVACCALLIYPLGTNYGAYLTYHTQLLMPILAFLATEKSNGKFINTASCQLVTILSLIYCVYKTPLIHIPDNDGWKKIEAYIQESDYVLNSECVAPLLLQQNKPLTNDGVSGFVYEFEKKEITYTLFGKDEVLLDKQTSYINSFKDKINNEKFALLLLHHRPDEEISNRYDTNNYVHIDEIQLDLPSNWPIMISVFRPLTIKQTPPIINTPVKTGF